MLIIAERGVVLEGRDVLHIAPEWPLYRRLRGQPGYVGGDIIRRRHSNARVDITDIQFPADTFEVLIFNHVLEHVPNDAKAMAECFRVLRPGGTAIFSVPLSGEEKTFEPPPHMPKAEVERICGWDHVRVYGDDFSEKLEAVGFDVAAVRYPESVRERHRLFDEPIFVASKSAVGTMQ